MSRRESLKLLLRTGRPYRGSLVAGTLFSLGVVLTRLALPWPLRGLMETVFEPESSQFGQSVLVFCLSYLLLAISSGIFELMQRVNMARFSSRTAHDMRADAMASVVAEPGAVETSAADLVTRIIGDIARMKADLKGILIHVTQNGLLLIGVSILFLVIAPKLGLLFLVGAAAAILIGMLTVDEVEQNALQQRRKESRYAARIHEDDRPVSVEEGQLLNDSSARKDVRTTRLIGRATLWAHAAVAVVISLALWVGASDVRAGAMAPGELFLFVAYALMVHRRAVRVGRQVARVGKLMACVGRVAALITPRSEEKLERSTSPPQIRLSTVRVPASPVLARKTRLREIDLVIEPAEHVALIGPAGAGVSALLELIAGRLVPSRGKIIVDGRDVTGELRSLRRRVACLRQNPELGSGLTPRMVCNLDPNATPSAEMQEILTSVGAWNVIHSLADGWDQPLAPHSLSPGERRALVLGGILTGPSGIWILDRPICGSSKKEQRRLAAVLDRAKGRTLLIGLAEPCMLNRFDRVLVLRRGRVRFDGTPADWKEWRAGERARKLAAGKEASCPPTER